MVKRRKTKGPLRRIVDVLERAPDLFSRQKVMLECGHVVRASSGASYRARCYKCRELAESDATEQKEG